MHEMTSSKKPAPAQVLSKALDILDIIGDNREPLSLARIVQLSGLSKTTAHRLLHRLEAHQYISMNSHAEYSLGPRIACLGARALHASIGGAGYEYARALFEATKLTVCLTVLNGFDAVYLQRFAPNITIRQNVGDTVPAHTTAFGKCQLAYLPEQVLDSLIALHGLARRTEKTLCDPELLKADLRLTRERGYAVNRGESTVYVDGIAAPVFDFSGKTVGAVSIAIIVPLHDRDVLEYKDQLVQTAARISERMGYVPSPSAPVGQRRQEEPGISPAPAFPPGNAGHS